MAAFGEHGNGNWSSGLHWKRLQDEADRAARDVAQVMAERRSRKQAATIDADYVDITPPQQQEMK